MNMRRRLFADIVKAGSALLLCFQLGACALLEEEPAPKTPPPPKPAVSTPAPVPVLPPVKPERQTTGPATRPTKPPPTSPDELVGLDEGGVRRLLGMPTEIRTDGAARILSYRSVACTLDVIFFLDLKAGDLRVLSYQLDNNPNRTQAAKGCYAEMRVTP
jgi:hypothetical protein